MKMIYFLSLTFWFTYVSCGSHTNESKEVDICKCLMEPSNSNFMRENDDACRDAISRELGVQNWEKINLSQNPTIHSKFKALANRCL